MKKLILAALMGFVGTVFADTVDLSQYKWAVIGDDYSNPAANPKPKYVDLIAQQTGIKVVYTNASASGYWKNCATTNCFYQRLQANPVPADVDVITLFGTMNDLSYQSEEYNGRAKVVPGEAGDSLPTLSYAAYVNAAIDTLIRQAPQAKIILVGPLYRKGPQEFLQKNYISDMLAKIAEYRGLEFHNWYDGMEGNPLDYSQIKSNETFAAEYVYNYRTNGWYDIPSASYHAAFIAPQIKSYLENALVGAGVPSVSPELGSLQIVPWGTSAVFYTTITRLGTGATAGDVYVAYGTEEGKLGAPVKIFDGATGKIDAELKGLAMNTKYYFSLTFKNNAATALTAPALTGSFTTTAEVRPDWSAKKWALIGDSISDPNVAYNGTGVSPYYNFVARDTGIQVAYLSAIGSTGWGHDKDADPTGCPCFYKRLLSDKWRLPSDIDVVTIFGSNNDRHQFYNNIGNATDTFEDGKDTYCCYVNGTIELVRQQAPNAKIIIISGVYGHGTEQVKLDAVTAAVRAVAEHQNIPFYDWATEDPNNPYDLHRMSDFDKTTGPKEGDFAYKYIVDWGLWNINTGRFGHPNTLYHEEYYSPKFRQMITDAFASGPASAGGTVRLGVPTARPSTDYNGSTVSVSFTGTLPEGSVATAKVTVGGVDYAGTISGGTAFFTVPADVATAGNTYTGTITVTVDGKDYSKAVALSQGTIVAEVNASWIAESATALNTTGTWSGNKAVAANGRIAVSNAVFTAATPSPTKAVVTITSTLDFVGANEDPFPASAMAGVKVVKVASANRYAFLTGNGVVTNLEATANVRSAIAVTTTIDLGTDEVCYTIAGTTFGPYARVGSAARVSGVRFDGETSVDSVAGSHRFEGLDASLASVNGVKYATVDEAVAAAGGSTVKLLWDASWAPAKGGDYTLSKNGFNLAIGGELAYSVKDNGNGTVTVSVTGGAESDVPQATQITFEGNAIKVGVANAKAGLWYALEKTTDLTKPFAIDASTWTSGDDIIAGGKDLVVQLGGTDKQAFYRVVVSTTAP